MQDHRQECGAVSDSHRLNPHHRRPDETGTGFNT